jgi:hypothetical protein
LAGNSYQGGGPSSPIEVIGQLESIGKSRFAVSALEQKARLGINIFGLNSVAGASGKTLVQFVSEALDERTKERTQTRCAENGGSREVAEEMAI